LLCWVRLRWCGGLGRLGGGSEVVGWFFAPAAPSHSRPFWGLRPQTPAIGLNGLVLKRRTGWVGWTGPRCAGARARRECACRRLQSCTRACGGKTYSVGLAGWGTMGVWHP
jgi:hypothetical protein